MTGGPAAHRPRGDHPVSDTMLHQSIPFAGLRAGLLAHPHQRWQHLTPLSPGFKRRRLAEVVVTAHPSYPVRVPQWRRAAHHLPNNSR